MAAKNKPNELYITRLYDAPVSAVWDAWTNPAQVAKWWGPRGFTLTHHSKDFRVGGHWKYTMHGPDGTDYPNKTIYYEIEKHKRMVYDHGGSDDRPPLFRVTVEFTEIKGKTQMEMTMALADEKTAKETAKFIKKAGGNGTWDRLAEYLESEMHGNEKFFINRTFSAPIETMFQMWTNPEHLSKWLPPEGLDMTFVRADLKPGRTSFFKMFAGADFSMYGLIHYLEITPPYRLVYTQQFCDQNENITRHPMAPVWPETMKTKVTFTEESSNQTRVTIEWEPVGNVTAEEMNAFIAEKGGMTQGWTGSFDKLDAFLNHEMLLSLN